MMMDMAGLEKGGGIWRRRGIPAKSKFNFSCKSQPANGPAETQKTSGESPWRVCDQKIGGSG